MFGNSVTLSERREPHHWNSCLWFSFLMRTGWWEHTGEHVPRSTKCVPHSSEQSWNVLFVLRFLCGDRSPDVETSRWSGSVMSPCILHFVIFHTWTKNKYESEENDRFKDLWDLWDLWTGNKPETNVLCVFCPDWIQQQQVSDDYNVAFKEIFDFLAPSRREEPSFLDTSTDWWVYEEICFCLIIFSFNLIWKWPFNTWEDILDQFKNIHTFWNKLVDKSSTLTVTE